MDFPRLVVYNGVERWEMGENETIGKGSPDRYLSMAGVIELVALGTHPLMSPDGLRQLVGARPDEGLRGRLFNHHCENPDTFAQVGVISREETALLSRERLSLEVPVRLNRNVLGYDLLLVCGPVFQHHLAGFSPFKIP